MGTVEQWGIFELALPGPAEGNPFVEVDFGADFYHLNRAIPVDGFYDGDGTYRLRFMPDALGDWSYITRSNRPELDRLVGGFSCTAPSPGNHGPVGLLNRYHFAYADGTPYRQLGTTCYAWAHQGEALEEQTLATLKQAPFNKLRMCVFPKHYLFNANEPEHYPFERGADGRWDFARFHPAFWQHFERRVGNLRDLGIEADIILFHPYDRWGFADMGAEADDRYLRYTIARLAAYRNVWWSLANEYDLMQSKSLADWERFARLIQERDPYGHPRSIHNCHVFYDHSKPWVTHCSIQRSDLEQTRLWRETYGKPVIVDECCYEGNIQMRWGDITPQEMVRRFWEGTSRGGYVGHGETYLDPNDVLWWSKGGTLHGQSPARLAFLRQVLDEAPAEGLDPIDGLLRTEFPASGQPGRYYLIYFGFHQPAAIDLNLPEGETYAAEILDTWEMTRTAAGLVSGPCRLDLPGKPYVALVLRRF